MVLSISLFVELGNCKALCKYTGLELFVIGW